MIFPGLFREMLLYALTVLIISLCISPAFAQSRWIEDFSDFDEETCHIEADAYWDEEEEFFVLTEAVGNQRGRIYNLTEMHTAIFTVEFDIRIGGGSGADGATFAWVKDYEYEGNGGGSHDFSNADGFAIEFDCYTNGGFGDPNGQHIALLQNDVEHHLATWEANDGEIEDNQWHHVAVSCFMGHVEVEWEDEVIIEYDIEDYEPFGGYFGFTAATGGSNNWHIVDNVQLVVGGPSMELSAEEIEFGPVNAGNSREFDLEISNVSEDDDEWHVLDFILNDVGEGIDWMEIEPGEGHVDVGDSVLVTLTAVTDELETGEYERTLIVESNDPDRLELHLPVHIFVVEGFGRLYGTVTDPDDDDRPLEGVLIDVDGYAMSAITDENGEYEFPEMPAWTYNLTVTLDDYLPLHEENVEIGEDDEVELNFGILHSECSPDPNMIETALGPDETLEIPLTIRNGGNGPLSWSVERIFPEEQQAETWEYRGGFDVEAATEDSRISAVEFDGDYYYIGGGNGGDAESNFVYVLNTDGEVVNTFDQPVISRSGIRDFAWDGEYLWGGEDETTYAFDTEGNVAIEFRSPLNPTTVYAWDEDNGLLWVSGSTTDIIALDREGNEVANIGRPEENIHKRGLAWYSDDPDGYNLYMFCSDGDTRRQVYKANPEDGDIVMVADLPEPEGQAAGLTITGLWDPYSWVFMGILQGEPDLLAVWHLGNRNDWLAIDPVEGIIDARGSEELIVTLDSEGLPEETEFEAVLQFTHDGVSGMTEIPVHLSVTGAGGMSQRLLSLDAGWNAVSLNIEPIAETFVEVLAPLIDEGKLVIAKNGHGDFYWPEYEYYNIESWIGTEGYQLKLSASSNIIISGLGIAWDEGIPLADGWNFVSYLPRQAVDAPVALSGLGDALTIAKDGSGNFYVPSWEFSNMGMMSEGHGYFLEVSGDLDLYYNLGEDRNATAVSRPSSRDLAWISELPNTGSSFSLLILADGYEPGTRLEAISTSRRVAGRGVVDAFGRCGMALWGDDPATREIDGLTEGEAFVIQTADGAPLTSKTVEGEASYQTDGFSVVRLTDGAELPLEFGIVSAYPNPFNSTIRITYSLAEASDISLKFFDLSGREVKSLEKGQQAAGEHTLSLSGDGMASGVYIAKLANGRSESTQKILLLR